MAPDLEQNSRELKQPDRRAPAGGEYWRYGCELAWHLPDNCTYGSKLTGQAIHPTRETRLPAGSISGVYSAMTAPAIRAPDYALNGNAFCCRPPWPTWAPPIPAFPSRRFAPVAGIFGLPAEASCRRSRPAAHLALPNQVTSSPISSRAGSCCARATRRVVTCGWNPSHPTDDCCVRVSASGVRPPPEARCLHEAA